MLGLVKNIAKEKMQIKKTEINVSYFQRKNFYKTWNCEVCEHSYFFAVLRCPLCESHTIKKMIHPLASAVKEIFK